MKKNVFLTVGMVMLFSMAWAQDPSLDFILSACYKTMGFDSLQKVNTITMAGTIIQQDAMPVKMIRMRPDRFLLEFDIQDITAYQGYDGQTAWWTTPWTGNPKPQAMPADRAAELKGRADFDGLLYNWKAKGHTVELTGRDTVEQAPVYKLKVTKKEGGVEYLFIDATKFLVLKRMYYRIVRGKEIAMEIYFRDYRAIHGILFAFTQDTHYSGQPYNSLQFETVELNKPVEASMFSMPAK